MRSRILHPGEILAIDPSAVRRGADGFMFMFGADVPPNERHPIYSDVTIVHVRGALDHHEGGSLDSYDAIAKRVASAVADDPVGVVLCIDSRGGAVAGMAECIATLRTMTSAVPMMAFVNEMAASAAYALACACDKIACPRSALLGSIGTIATMGSQFIADQEGGIDIRLIASGARKTDGNPHTPISDEAVAAERARVDASARDFFRLVAGARGMKASVVEGLEAGLFMGSQAYAIGLADIVCSLDDLCSYMSEIQTQLDDVAQPAQHGTSEQGSAMNLKALITKTEAALLAATDPKKKVRLEADLAAFKLTSLRAESDKDDDKDDDDDDDDDKAKKAKAAADKAARKATAMKHRAKAAEFKQKAKECEDQAKEAMAEDSEDATAAAEPIAAELSPGAVAALAGQSDIAASNAEAIASMQARLDASDRTAIVESAFSGRRITPAERKTLLGKPLPFVQDFLAMRPKAIVQSAGDEIQVPPMSGSSPITESMRADLAAEVAKLQAMGSKITIESASAALEKSLNGKAPVV